MKLKTETLIEILVGSGRVCFNRFGKYTYIRVRVRGLTQVEADRFVRTFGGTAKRGRHSWGWFLNSAYDIAKLCTAVFEYADECASVGEFGEPIGRTDIDRAAEILGHVHRYSQMSRGHRSMAAWHIMKHYGDKRSIFLGGDLECIQNKCQ